MSVEAHAWRGYRVFCFDAAEFLALAADSQHAKQQVAEWMSMHPIAGFHPLLETEVSLEAIPLVDAEADCFRHLALLHGRTLRPSNDHRKIGDTDSYRKVDCPTEITVAHCIGQQVLFDTVKFQRNSGGERRGF